MALSLGGVHVPIVLLGVIGADLAVSAVGPRQFLVLSIERLTHIRQCLYLNHNIHLKKQII